MCGERERPPLGRRAITGSSPRVRGTGSRPGPLRPARRFIPACAGNGSTRRRSGPRGTVHPRVCGERREQNEQEQSYDGSSPRVRGTVARSAERRRLRRFIPACAGNGGADRCEPPPCSVHPRVCGERVRIEGEPGRERGSSPRVRGTAPIPGCTPGETRFIPACAGNGLTLPSPSSPRTVHPRVCGERLDPGDDQGQEFGSSPRVRGTDRWRAADRARRRFIPACAGNGSCCSSKRRCRPVHPRVCGERLRAGATSEPSTGSSPRVRGTATDGDRPRRMFRFIPACAGNGGVARALADKTTVHPRVCGERTNRMLLTPRHLPVGPVSTAEFRPVRRPATGNHRAPSSSGGENLTSFSPSKSCGIRRLMPTVSKSNPCSV